MPATGIMSLSVPTKLPDSLPSGGGLVDDRPGSTAGVAVFDESGVGVVMGELLGLASGVIDG